VSRALVPTPCGEPPSGPDYTMMLVGGAALVVLAGGIAYT